MRHSTAKIMSLSSPLMVHMDPTPMIGMTSTFTWHSIHIEFLKIPLGPTIIFEMLSEIVLVQRNMMLDVDIDIIF